MRHSIGKQGCHGQELLKATEICELRTPLYLLSSEGINVENPQVDFGLIFRCEDKNAILQQTMYCGRRSTELKKKWILILMLHC